MLSPRSQKSASPLLARGEHWTDQLTPEQLKQLPLEQKQKQEALQEIVLAERAYVRDLRIITKVFMEDMKERGLISKEEIASVFSNIPTLLDVHNGMLNALEQLKKEHGMICDDGIGRIFLDKANLFKHYANYCVNHIGMPQKLASLREQPKIAEFLEECKKNPECRNLTLDSFLITPLQRVAKYPLLLQSLLKYTERDNAEHASLLKAYEEIKNIVDQVNNRAQQEENARKMMDLQATVEQVHGEEAFQFCERGRYIVKDGPVRTMQGKKKNKNSHQHLVLFNDKLVLFKVKMKGKKQGYKLLAMWNFTQIVGVVCESTTSLPPNMRPRPFSRTGSETTSSSLPRLSLLTSTPLYPSPRRPSSSRKEGDGTDFDEVEHCIKITEKDSGTEYRLVFGSALEKEDWAAKMKEHKVEFRADITAEDKSVASCTDSLSTNAMWERKYHVEVEIRMELKKVLDQTMAQFNSLREEFEALKKEKDALKEENEKLRDKAWKKIAQKKLPRDRRSTEGDTHRPRSSNAEGGNTMENSDSLIASIWNRPRSKSKSKDKIKEKSKEEEESARGSRTLSNSLPVISVSKSNDDEANKSNINNNNNSPRAKTKAEREAAKKARTLGRKSLCLSSGVVKKDQPLPFLDLSANDTALDIAASSPASVVSPSRPRSARDRIPERLASTDPRA